MVKNKKILLIFFFAAVAVLGWYKFNQPARICGNKICEPFEGPENCCLDCHCLSGWICDEESKKCQKIEMKLSDKRAKELAISSVQNLGKQVNKNIDTPGVNIGRHLLTRGYHFTSNRLTFRFIYAKVNSDGRSLVMAGLQGLPLLSCSL